MATLLGTMLARLTLEDQSFTVGMRKARREIDQTDERVKRMQASVGKVGAFLQSAAAGFVGGLAFGGLEQAIEGGLDYASSLGEVAQQLGVTTATLQEYRYMATQVGVDQETMDSALGKLTRTIGEAAAGGKAQAAAFRELGVAVRTTSGELRTTDEVLPDLVRAFTGIEDPARRAALEIDLFGRAGQRLDTLLAGGTDQLNELRDAAHSLGIVLSDEQIQQADQTADKLSELSTVLNARISGTVADNAEAIYEFADALAWLATKAGDAWSALNRFEERAQASSRLISFFGDLQSWDVISGARPWGSTYTDARAAEARRDPNNWIARQNASVDAYGQRVRARGRQAGGVDPAPASGGGGGSASAARQRQQEAERAAQERQRNRERYEDDLARLEQSQLGIEAQLATNATARRDIALRQIELEEEAYNRDLQRRQRDGDLTATEATRLRIANAANSTAQYTLETNRSADEIAREQLSILNERTSVETDLVRGRLGEARTDAERRRLQLRLVDIEYDRQRAALDAVVASRTATDAERQIAQTRLAQLGTLRTIDRKAVERDTAGPLGSYLNQLPRSAEELNEAYQRVAADGLSDLNDGLVDAILNSRSLGDVMRQVSASIVADLLRIQVQRQITGALGNALGNLFGGGGGGAKSFGSAGSGDLKGFATGGSFEVGGRGGIDTNLIAFRATRGEMVNITRPGQDRGGRLVSFDLRGAVMTADLLGQMQVIANDTGGQLIADAQRRGARSQYRRIG